jgi:NADP-dependent 3-hydroxy acid dehydrogenase YdfG
MANLTGLVGVVTGASSGIGEGLAKMLAAEGVKVALAARRVNELDRVAVEIRSGGGTAMVAPTNVREEDQLKNLIERTQQELGPIDLLDNSAGVARNQPIHKLNIKHWDLVMDVNLRAPAYLCSMVLPGMRARRRGFIINIASEAGVFVCAGMGADMPNGNPEHFLKVDEVVDVVRCLLKQGDNVKLGPEILIRTMLDPFEH